MIHVIVEFKDPYSKPIVLLVVEVVNIVKEVVVSVKEVVLSVKLSKGCSRKGWSDRSEWLFGFGSP